MLPILRGATVTEIARQAGMDRAGLSDYLRRRSPRRPPTETLALLSEIASALAVDRGERLCAVRSKQPCDLS